jgi:hypothetical protein
MPIEGKKRKEINPLWVLKQAETGPAPVSVIDYKLIVIGKLNQRKSKNQKSV